MAVSRDELPFGLKVGKIPESSNIVVRVYFQRHSESGRKPPRTIGKGI